MGIRYGLGDVIKQFFVLGRTTAISAGGKDSDEFKHVGRKVLLKCGVLALIENDNLHLLRLTDGKNQFSAERSQRRCPPGVRSQLNLAADLPAAHGFRQDAKRLGNFSDSYHVWILAHVCG